jgi:hypothetical protein
MLSIPPQMQVFGMPMTQRKPASLQMPPRYHWHCHDVREASE